MEFDEKSSHKGIQGGFFASLTGFSSPNREKRASSWILQRAPLRSLTAVEYSAFSLQETADSAQYE